VVAASKRRTRRASWGFNKGTTRPLCNAHDCGHAGGHNKSGLQLPGLTPVGSNRRHTVTTAFSVASDRYRWTRRTPFSGSIVTVARFERRSPGDRGRARAACERSVQTSTVRDVTPSRRRSRSAASNNLRSSPDAVRTPLWVLKTAPSESRDWSWWTRRESSRLRRARRAMPACLTTGWAANDRPKGGSWWTRRESNP
jgi:hypothetical protein